MLKALTNGSSLASLPILSACVTQARHGIVHFERWASLDEDDDDLLDDIDLPNSNKLLDEEGAGETDYQDSPIANIPGTGMQEYSYDDFEDFETSTSDVETRKGSTGGAVEGESQINAKTDIDRPGKEDSQGKPPRIPFKSSRNNDSEAYKPTLWTK